MTSEKNKKIIFLLIGGVAILLSVSFILISESSCGIRHIWLINEIQNYEKTLDPEFCAMLIEKIDDFNYECQPQIEILDCG